jgi:hypothetical protein
MNGNIQLRPPASNTDADSREQMSSSDFKIEKFQIYVQII